MSVDTLSDVAAGVCLVVGSLMSLAAAVGMLRFPDLLSRMHAGTKPQVLGLLLMLTAVAIQGGRPGMIPLLILAWVFMLMTVPVSAHMVGRAAYRSKHLREENLTQDDLKSVVEYASEQTRAGNGNPWRTSQDVEE